MAFQNHPLEALKKFIPTHSFNDVVYFIESYNVHLKITRERKTIYGNYRPAMYGKQHTITINGNLNPYHFLITLLHELAHLINFLNHGQKVKPHGTEWKTVFNTLLIRFINNQIFPSDIASALASSIQKQKSSSCFNPDLFEVLYQYNTNTEGFVLLKTLSIGDTFANEKNETFTILEKRRSKFLCKKNNNNIKYLFPIVFEVKKITPQKIEG
ncbi:MAG: SprT-like domain-containing protein [Chitinophagaceae bacterium]